MPYMFDTPQSSASLQQSEQQHGRALQSGSSTTINPSAANGPVAVASTSEHSSSIMVTHAGRQFKSKASSAPAFSTAFSNARTENAVRTGARDSFSLPAEIAGQEQAIPHALLRYLRSWERHEMIALALTRDQERQQMNEGSMNTGH